MRPCFYALNLISAYVEQRGKLSHVKASALTRQFYILTDLGVNR